MKDPIFSKDKLTFGNQSLNDFKRKSSISDKEAEKQINQCINFGTDRPKGKEAAISATGALFVRHIISIPFSLSIPEILPEAGKLINIWIEIVLTNCTKFS